LRDQRAYNGLPDCPVLDPWLTRKIVEGGLSSVDRWNRVNIFLYDFVIAPICESEHWYVVILCYIGSFLQTGDSRGPRLMVLDSLYRRHCASEGKLKDFIAHEAIRLGTRIDKEKIKVTPSVHLRQTIPRQQNSFDCGLFMLIYCERFLLDPSGFVQVVFDKTTSASKDEWGDLRSSSIRKRYRALLDRFAQSKTCDNMLLDNANTPIIDGVLGVRGKGLMGPRCLGNVSP
jgi:Ulp1 family protease